MYLYHIHIIFHIIVYYYHILFIFYVIFIYIIFYVMVSFSNIKLSPIKPFFFLMFQAFDISDKHSRLPRENPPFPFEKYILWILP